MPRRLAIALAALALLAAEPAHAMIGDEVCDETGDAAELLLASIASLTPAPATLTPATLAPAAPASGAATDAASCRGDRLTDDPSCWPESPAGAPHSGGFLGVGGPDASLIAQAALPRPESTSVSPPRAAAGAERPGYARGIERPPRS